MERCDKDITDIKWEEFSDHENMTIAEKMFAISEDSINLIKTEISDLYFDHDYVKPAHIKTDETEDKELLEHDSTMLQEDGIMSKHMNNVMKIEDSFIIKDEVNEEWNSDLNSLNTLVESHMKLENAKERSEAAEKQNHEMEQKSAAEGMYKCEMCPYVSRYKSQFSEHTISHLVTKNKGSNARRMLIHKKLPDGSVYQCDTCPYSSKRMSILKRHIMMRHESGAEVKLYKCVQCLFRTKYEASLQKHAAHCYGSMYHCDECRFSTKHMWALKRHMMSHDIKCGINSENKVYSCDVCSFQTKLIASLQKHAVHCRIIPHPVEPCTSDASIRLKTRIKARLQHYMGSLPSSDTLV